MSHRFEDSRAFWKVWFFVLAEAVWGIHEIIP